MALPFPRTVVRVSQATRDEVESGRKVASLFADKFVTESVVRVYLH